MNKDSKLRRAALEYAANGLAVFPLVPGQKYPAYPHGSKEATVDPAQIEAWWSKNPNYNIGLLLLNGIVVIDLDVNHGDSAVNGIETFVQYMQDHGAFPSTAICITPRGGRHLYYKVYDMVRTQINAYPGIDIHGDNDYVVAPPSVTEDGVYRWVGQSFKDGISEENDNVLDFIAEAAWKLTPSYKHYREYLELSDIHEYLTVPKLFRDMFLLSQIVTMKDLGYSKKEIKEIVSELNKNHCDPPFTEKELRREIFREEGSL